MQSIAKTILNVTHACLHRPTCNQQAKITLNTRFGGEDTTFEAKAKDSEKVRSQGPSCRGEVASKPRTERLEAKAKYSRTRLKIRSDINVNIVIMISQAFKRKIEKMG